MIALDGYNWGTLTEWGIWQDFADIFEDGYDIVKSLSSKPLMIGEIGCTEFGGDKAAWINNMFSILQSRFERIKAIIWFDVDKECDWRICSSNSALNAFRSKAQEFFTKYSD